jgi:hypothetical protein
MSVWCFSCFVGLWWFWWGVPAAALLAWMARQGRARRRMAAGKRGEEVEDEEKMFGDAFLPCRRIATYFKD